MDPATISALAALGGSVVGGVTTGLSTWISQRASAKAGMLSTDLTRRQELFRDFIVLASRAYSEALTSNDPKIPEILDLYALVSRMRALCRLETASAAEKLMRLILKTYSAPNKTFVELREMVANEQLDPLKEFSLAAREEIEAARHN